MSWTAIKTVYSETTGEKYYIKRSTTTKEYSCTCKSWIFNQEDPKTCKHIRVVINEAKIKKADSYWVVMNPKGVLAKESLFKNETTAKWWANYFNDHFLYPNTDYRAVKVTLKRSK